MRNSVLLLLLLTVSCNISDATLGLGNGYTLIIEGRGANRIISSNADRKGITADVVQYANLQRRWGTNWTFKRNKV